MTYFEFHLLLILPAILVLWGTLPQSLKAFGGLRARWAIPLIGLIAFSYTTPWDNYLVASEVWWYSSDRVLATIGAVPVEEYLFFILQPILTGLFCFHYLMRRPSAAEDPHPMPNSTPAWLGFLFFAGLAAIGGLLLGYSGPTTTYLALILSWACPLLAGMWLYDGETLWAHRKTMGYAVGIPTLYLWLADAVAIFLDIWIISDAFTIGISAFGLPLEEATFFLVTNLLVVKGILLLLYGSHTALGEPAPPATSRARM